VFVLTGLDREELQRLLDQLLAKASTGQ
jgi:hypothetical protein